MNTTCCGSPSAGAETRDWRSWMNAPKSGWLDLGMSTSVAVMMALTCSKLTTIARSRPRIVDGYDSAGSRTLRSRAGKPVRRMMVCFPSSSRRDPPESETTIHALIAVPFLRAVVPWGAGAAAIACCWEDTCGDMPEGCSSGRRAAGSLIPAISASRVILPSISPPPLPPSEESSPTLLTKTWQIIPAGS